MEARHDAKLAEAAEAARTEAMQNAERHATEQATALAEAEKLCSDLDSELTEARSEMTVAARRGQERLNVAEARVVELERGTASY
eukprot:SAG11_NODE_12265_length_712_cov_1.086460_1_plen_84_part_10